MNATILEHSADGIEELDNPLPRWWLYLFYATILFAVYYSIRYPSTWFWAGTDHWTQEKQWAATAPPKKDESLAPLSVLAAQPETLAAGKKIFINTCTPCHGMKAEGKIGPCLTDSVWKYGNEDKDILFTIRKGRPGGMPVWGNFLKPEQIGAVACYVHSIGNTTATPTNTSTPAPGSTPITTPGDTSSPTPGNTTMPAPGDTSTPATGNTTAPPAPGDTSTPIPK